MKKLLKKAVAVFAAITLSMGTVCFAQDAPAQGFVHAEGSQVIGTDGKPLQIKGMALGNRVWDNPTTAPTTHHTEDTYRELSEMGFNSVRMYLNYALFEDDNAPYQYKESGFEWIDLNIKWAKKYGMGIVLNMHAPQGGYQSLGDGLALWTDKENQKRLGALWGAIAKRYANEPTIWGYGLINEPYLPMMHNMENTFEYYNEVMQELVAQVRRNTPHQAIFVEKAMNIKSDRVDWEKFTLDASFPLFEDDNIIYEFHFYEPFSLTHSPQDATYAPKYPVLDLWNSEYESTWVGTHRPEKKSSGLWNYFESQPLTATDEYNVGILAMNVWNGKYATAYFDDIKVTEIAADGTRTTLYEYGFDHADEAEDFYPWSSDGSGTAGYNGNTGHNGKGCYEIKNAAADFTSGGERFVLEEGCSYIISGYVRTVGEAGSALPRIDLAKATRIVTVDKAELERKLLQYVEFSKKRNVPIYLGEFGCNNIGFRDGVSAVTWVGDMIDICNKYDISFNYHAYHEGWFGLYQSSDTVLPHPNDLNKPLAEVFRKKLNSHVAIEPFRELRKALPFI